MRALSARPASRCRSVRTMMLLAGVVILTSACAGVGGTASVSPTTGGASITNPESAPSTQTPQATTPAPTPGSPWGGQAQSGDDQTELSEGETAALTAELVEVDNYAYGDVTDADREDMLSHMPEEYTAAAFHDVIDASTDTSICLLSLYVPPPTEAMFAPDQSLGFGQWALQTNEVTELTFSGQQVWFTDITSDEWTGVEYAWNRHGTFASVFGDDRIEVDAFLTAYFAVPFHGAEDPILAERMVTLADYVYTNAVDRPDAVAAAETLFPGTTAAGHYVFDRTHQFAGLVLVGPVGGEITDDQIVVSVGTWAAMLEGRAATELTDIGDLVVGDTTVHHAVDPASGMDMFVWRWTTTGVIGWLSTDGPDIGEQFVSEFVAAPPAEG